MVPDQGVDAGADGGAVAGLTPTASAAELVEEVRMAYLAVMRARPPLRPCALAALLLAAPAGCGDRPRPADAPVASDSAAAVVPADSALPTGDVAQPAPFSQPTVVFMEASDEELAAARGKMTEDDFAIVADDLSFYRSSAWEYLQKRALPVVKLTGRRPLEFVVDGKVQRYDYSALEHLDVVVLYDGKHEPRAIAPIEIAQVDTFFASSSRDR
jgi:hypothetical protein